MIWKIGGSICPTCGGPGRESPRHPGALCQKCQAIVVDSAGNPAILANESFSGGLKVTVGGKTIKSMEAEGLPLYTNGIECRAKSYRFGGVVVQPLQVWQALADRRGCP
ncbi:hypothetical protein [Bradyrhizobium sp. CCGUVB14]|uniref:hypothetical protein n=1 Tax=Bradyrhizobium sp. CCGUVB14 TaxID=2949628 RepID=UPI0020B3CE2A|nr:hypothetical protein [Bradyrhizobium sp. CCGUVB14]MCP3446200.1 hypothetical protein [Bradyrhizobium sp. CCGUVB14]